MINADPSPASPPPLPPPRSRAGWWGLLLLLTAYPVVLGSLGYFLGEKHQSAALSPNPVQLLLTVSYELLIFAVVFLIACRFSRVRTDELLLGWRDGWRPWLRGAGYSIALRVFVAIGTLAAVAVYALFHKVDETTLQGLRPKVEVLVDPAAMASDPLYLLLNMTLVSFVMAGFREELWRAGMLAALRSLWPERFGSLRGGIAASAIVAIAFGLGHAPQGWGAMGLTAVLGFGLGAIMVYHRSIWDAVLAHGFFNASSFLLLWYVARNHPEILTGSQ